MKISNLRVVSWNMRCTSLDSMSFLEKFISESDPDVINLQETRHSRIYVKNYDCFYSQTKMRDGIHGTCTLVRQGLSRVKQLHCPIPLSVLIELTDLNITSANLYISSRFLTYKEEFESWLQKHSQDLTYLICGDLNYVSNSLFNTFETTRVGQESNTNTDHIYSKQLQLIEQRTIHAPSDHMLLYKEFAFDIEVELEERVSKNRVNRQLKDEQAWFGSTQVKPKPVKRQNIKSTFLTAVNNIKHLWFTGNLKDANRLIQRRIGQDAGKIVNQLQNQTLQQSLISAQRYISIQGAGQYIIPIQNRNLDEQISQPEIGATYWRYTPRHKLLTDILRNSPTDKALGPDNISDQWLRKGDRAQPIMMQLCDWVNKSYTFPSRFNDSNLMLLSKTDSLNPPIEKTRQIAMTSIIRKMQEATWMGLYSHNLWQTVMKQQIGFRPHSLMGKHTAELIEIINKQEFEQLWFIDISSAFPSVPMTILVEELARRKQILEGLSDGDYRASHEPPDSVLA